MLIRETHLGTIDPNPARQRFQLCRSALVATAEDQQLPSTAGLSSSRRNHDKFRSKKGMYNYEDTLDECDCTFAPVSAFAHAPLNKYFNAAAIRPGLIVEVPNGDFRDSNVAYERYWMARIVRICGYKVLLRYIGLSEAESQWDFWYNICSRDIHPVGWCAQHQLLLIPPFIVAEIHKDYRRTLIGGIVGKRQLFPLWNQLCSNSMADNQFRINHRLEFCGWNFSSARIRPMLVADIIGRRLYLVSSVDDLASKKKVNEEYGFWCDYDSPLIFPVGWAVRNNYRMNANKKYSDHCLNIVRSDPEGFGYIGEYAINDARPHLFLAIKKKFYADHRTKWTSGEDVECIDPLDLSCVTVGRIESPMTNGYLKIRFSCERAAMPMPRDSPYLFALGFCEWYGIELDKTEDDCPMITIYDDMGDSSSATIEFKIGDKLEAFDMHQDTGYICPATIVDIKASRLLRIHFDGWDSAHDLWTDYRSGDIGPIGWCEMLGYFLHSPRRPEDAIDTSIEY